MASGEEGEKSRNFGLTAAEVSVNTPAKNGF